MGVNNASLSNFVSTLFFVYYAMMIAWVILGMVNLPYSSALRVVREFLDQTVRPYVALFRRFVPMVGPLDLSPLVAFIALQVGRAVLSRFFGI